MEGEGVAILRMVLEESDDDELIDLGFEIITSLILDGKLCFCSWQWLLKSFLMSDYKKKEGMINLQSKNIHPSISNIENLPLSSPQNNIELTILQLCA